MTTISTGEARKNLSHLLERVEQGERFIITKRGLPVARLVPAGSTADVHRVEQAIEQFRMFRKTRPRVTRQEIRAMIDEGRRRTLE